MKKMYVYKNNFTSFFDGGLDVSEINRKKKSQRLTTNEFIKKAKSVHGDRFDYSKCNYVDRSTKFIVICKTHNIEFMQTPINHIYGPIGCPVCNKNIRSRNIRKKIEIFNRKRDRVCSVGENLIEFWLNKHSIKYEKQKTFNGCKNRKKLRYDFYLPSQNILIEYDGRQHFKPIECFGGENELKLTQLHDKIKTEFAENNNIDLLRISYKEINNISMLLKNKLINT